MKNSTTPQAAEPQGVTCYFCRAATDNPQRSECQGIYGKGLDMLFDEWYNTTMKRKEKQFDTRLLGRAPDCGRVSFKTGMALSDRNRLGDRNSKLARRELRQQINGD